MTNEEIIKSVIKHDLLFESVNETLSDIEKNTKETKDIITGNGTPSEGVVYKVEQISERLNALVEEHKAMKEKCQVINTVTPEKKDEQKAPDPLHAMDDILRWVISTPFGRWAIIAVVGYIMGMLGFTGMEQKKTQEMLNKALPIIEAQSNTSNMR